MEATALSVGKSVLDGALGYAKSALAEEVALQLGIQRDHAFIRDELEMMRAFLVAAAHEEHDNHTVVKTWVKQVRDVAYDAEDSLQDFAVRLGKPSWWRLPRTLLDRRRVAARMKELRAKVEDVSQRNVRYQLIRGSGPNAATSTEQRSSMASLVMSGTEEQMRQRNKAKMALIRLIQYKRRGDDDLRVIAIWGANKGTFGETSTVKRAYDDVKRGKKFECQSWISITHPFNRVEFVQNIIRQFFTDSLHEAAEKQEQSGPGVPDLRRMGTMMESDLIDAFQTYVSQKRFLIVLGNVCSNQEWNQIKECFPTNKKGSRLVVCTEYVEVASLCVGKETEFPEHKQLSDDPALFAFYDKDSRDGTYSTDPGPSSNVEITEENTSSSEKRLIRMGTIISAFKESQLVGRMNEESEIIKLVSDNSSQQFQVISICGMGGLGKTTLVKHVYQSQELCDMFEKRACVTIKRPFDPNELLNSLATQVTSRDREDKPGIQQSVTDTLEGKKYLLILDDLSSTAEWDAVNHYFPRTESGSRIIVTTRVEKIAKHCSKEKKNICKLKFLGEEDACNLFTEKVFGKIINLDEHFPELAELAKLILKKCNGLPLAIVTIGGFLSKQPKTLMEWRKLNEHIGFELEMNQELETIKDVLIKSYDGLPYHLKSCFLYISIFPEDYNISRKRLVRRWIAEGYSHGVRSKSLKNMADNYFIELIDRSMILPFQTSIGCRNGIDSCQVHDLMREISISKSLEENLVFRMENGCSSNNLGTTRHLSISRNWEGDESEFEGVTDLSRIRSLTVFASWRPFFISEKMRLLRVLDLEGTEGLYDRHLREIGKLIHLKYLSVRGCQDLFHLPDSLGNLKQLQTLDIYDTSIIKLPQCIVKLQKLQYIRALKTLSKKIYRARMVYLAANIFLKSQDNSDYSQYSEMCNQLRKKKSLYKRGVVVPRGLRKMKDLHTLGVVNIARGKYILQDIGCLTQLHKLAVIGISKKNCEEFCSILARLSCLESLSVMSVEEAGLQGCLDAVSSSPLKSIQSLKLYGNLIKLPEWIGGFPNLVKLKLKNTRLSDVDATMQLLGKIPNLAILRLSRHSFNGDVGMGRRITFRGADAALFLSLMVLELKVVFDDDTAEYEFEEGAMPKLELLCFFCYDGENVRFSGLASLPKLKEFKQSNFGMAKQVQDQLAENPNQPMFTRRYPSR